MAAIMALIIPFCYICPDSLLISWCKHGKSANCDATSSTIMYTSLISRDGGGFVPFEGVWIEYVLMDGFSVILPHLWTKSPNGWGYQKKLGQVTFV